MKIKLIRSSVKFNGKYIYAYPANCGTVYSIRWNNKIGAWAIKLGHQQWLSYTLSTVRQFIADREGIQS